LLRKGGLGPETLKSRKLKETVWGRNLKVKDWTQDELRDGRFRVLMSWCALVRFAWYSVCMERYGTDVWEVGDEIV